jgi:hypothetical protein
VAILLYQERLEAPLPNSTVCLVFEVMSSNVRREEPMRPTSDVCVRTRANDEVDMIRHQAGGEQREMQSLLTFVQERKE